MDYSNNIKNYSLHSESARNLSHSTKSTPIMEAITPRWLLKLLPWVNVEAGVYKLNKRKNTQNHYAIDAISNPVMNLYTIPPFKYMNPNTFETITEYVSEATYNTGDVILKDDVEGDKLLFVVQGQINITTTNNRNESIKVGHLSSGGYSDIYAFLKNSQRPITVTSLTDSTLYLIERDALEYWLSQSEDIENDYYNALSHWENNLGASNEHGEKSITVHSGELNDYTLPTTYPDYEETPKEFTLNVVQTVLKMNTQITDIFNSPINQQDEQMRLTIEAIQERQEYEMLNNATYGLIQQIAPHMKTSTKHGAPTPDDLDDLLAKVWKSPAFFLAHPKAIAAFGRECTKRGVPPVAVNLWGSPFITWRGVPIIPTDKLLINGKKTHASCGTTNILLMRVGEKEQGVIGLHQQGIPDEQYLPSLSVKYGGIDDNGLASYIMRLYYSIAVLADDAIAMLQDVEVGYYDEF